MSVVVKWQKTRIEFWKIEMSVQYFKMLDSGRAEFRRGMTPQFFRQTLFFNFWPSPTPDEARVLEFLKCWPPRNQINTFGFFLIFDPWANKSRKYSNFWPSQPRSYHFLQILKFWPAPPKNQTFWKFWSNISKHLKMLKAMAMRGSRISKLPKNHEREQPNRPTRWCWSIIKK